MKDRLRIFSRKTSRTNEINQFFPRRARSNRFSISLVKVYSRGIGLEVGEEANVICVQMGNKKVVLPQIHSKAL